MVTHRLQKLADQRIAQVAPITTAQAAVLSALKNEEANSQRGIARALGLNESAITAMMNRLIKAGYIERTKSQTDGRIWQLTITEAGNGILAETVAPFSTINAILERALSDQELEQFANYLERIQDVAADDAG
nr:MarR family transcriptional regulator [Hyphomonas sp. Mor2]